MSVQPVPGVAPLRLDPTLDAAARARRYVEDFCALSPHKQACDVAVLLVSELVVNAVRHAGTPLQVHVLDVGDALRLSVTDYSRDMPQPRDAGLLDEGGRGLMLVELMSRRWGIEMTGDGKTIWVDIPATATLSGRSRPISRRTDGSSSGNGA